MRAPLAQMHSALLGFRWWCEWYELAGRTDIAMNVVELVD
jgi:hypothetical protein